IVSAARNRLACSASTARCQFSGQLIAALANIAPLNLHASENRMPFPDRTTPLKKLRRSKILLLKGAVALENRRLHGSYFGYGDSNVRAFAFLAADVHLELIPVEQPQALVDIAYADSAAVNLQKALARHSHAVVVYFDTQPPILPVRTQVDLSAFEAGRQSMFDRIFNDGLKQHAGDENIHGILVDFLEDLK